MRRRKQTQANKKKILVPQAAARGGSEYDKMIKENLKKSLRTIIQEIGGLSFIKAKPLPTKMQHTKERDPDELSVLTFSDGSEKILHAEVHLKDENEVNFRIGDYHIMVKRQFPKLGNIQYIIYIGSEDPKHITGYWESESMTLKFNLIVLKDVSYRVFLKARNPETVVLSILGNFEGEDPEIVGQQISNRLKTLAKTHAEREKFYTQLRVLSNARKLQPIIEKIMEKIHKLIDISDDPLLVRGKVEGKAEGKAEGLIEGELKGVKSLIINSDFDDAYIAFLIGVPIELVTKTRQELVQE